MGIEHWVEFENISSSASIAASEAESVAASATTSIAPIAVQGTNNDMNA